MVADKIEIKIEPKLVIPRETADLCARILETWLLSDDTANIEIINNRREKKIYLTSRQSKGE